LEGEIFEIVTGGVMVPGETEEEQIAELERMVLEEEAMI
jgi:hypothetical protein